MEAAREGTERVDAAQAGERLDAWLAGRLEGVTRSQLTRVVTQGGVRVDGAVVTKAGLKLRTGQEVRWTLPERASALPVAQDLPLEVVYADRWLAVVDKPAAMVVHPAAGHPDGTLVNALLHHLPELSDVDPQRPGIVHRLDQDTSGLLVVARDAATHAALGRLFQTHSIERRYVAVVLGPRLADEGSADTFYGRHPTERLKFSGRVARGRRAVTHWRVLARAETMALVAVRLETGRTHQIRVHLSEAGHPVVGDALYGRPLPKGGAGRAAVELAAARRMPRQALHAETLGFRHPATGETLRFRAPLPEDMAALVAQVFGPDALSGLD
ncbi:MAG: RluA family pseudouridine synthase [Deltaproteobacteria bacterium]|nr:RluA family pseudouridine synthase [Deltaproteobacteria bacterium]